MDEQETTLGVEISDSTGATTASYELSSGGAEIVAIGYEDEPEAAYRQAIQDLRHGLALAFCKGRMAPVLQAVDDEEAAKTAIASFSPEELTITTRDIKRAYEAESQAAQEQAEIDERHAEFIRAQEAYEGEGLTGLEAFRRWRAGREQMRDILGGESPEDTTP
jgi:hypothetical protein